jgi:cell wall-associated NlpC family hydrolase
VLPSAPMPRWILPLLIAAACSQAAIAAPTETLAEAEVASPQAPVSVAVPVKSESAVMRSFEQAGHTVAGNTSALVTTAMGFIGLRYRRGGNSAETGFDCSGFVRAVYEKTAGLVLPRRAKDQAASTEVIDKRDLKPGDLVFFNTMRHAFSHVGVYLGDGKFIHSPRTGQQVRVEDMQASYWQRRFNGARRVALDGDAVARLSLAQSLSQ